MKARLIALIIGSFASTASIAADPPNAVSEYGALAGSKVLICKMKVRIASNLIELGKEVDEENNPRKCVSDARKEIRIAYDKAVAATKKSGARVALKEHFVAVTSAIDGALPGLDERKILYNARVEAEERRVSEMWTRVKLEF